MLLLYVFIVLLILLTLLSAFGGSIRAAPAPMVRFEKFTDEEKEELEEFVASEPFRRGLYPQSPAPAMPIMANVVPLGGSTPSMYVPPPSMDSRPTPAPMMTSYMSPSMPPPSMEMYKEIDHAIEPFEQNDLMQASY